MITTGFGDLIAERIREHHRAIAARWFERLLALLPVDARDVFPTDTLLDHIPALILEISDYLRRPEDEAIAANTAILKKAQELGSLRHGQRASLHQILREYQILGGVLASFVVDEIDGMRPAPPAAEAAALTSRLYRAVNVLSQATVETFIALYNSVISAQTERLQEFTRIAAHEWRQPLGVVQFGITTLRRAELDPVRAERTWDTVDRNVVKLIDVTRKLEAVARMNAADDTPLIQEVAVSQVANEAARQLREMAEARGVAVRIDDRLPTITVDVGRLELTLVNLLSNAIKYADQRKPAPSVDVTGGIDDDGWCRIEVRDNGVGIPEHALGTVFQRFTRAHADREEFARIAGLGLGLAIVDDSVRAMEGRMEVASREGEGTVFRVILPRSPEHAARLQTI